MLRLVRDREAKTVHPGLWAICCVALICLCGCPLGTPNNHHRPHGHQDTTIAISPNEEAILFNAAGAGGRDLYLLRLADLKVLRVAEMPEHGQDARGTHKFIYLWY